MLKCRIIGNIGSDVELRYSASGSPLLRFNVASNYRTRSAEGEYQDKTEWVRVTVTGARAESLSQYLRKGSRVYVEGRLEARPWTDQQGQIRAGLEPLADAVEFMSPRQDDERPAPRRGPTGEPVQLGSGSSGRRMPEAMAVHGGRPTQGATAVADRDLEDLPFYIGGGGERERTSTLAGDQSRTEADRQRD